jgi:TRAP transporter TAXI family solute receptor
MRKVLVIAAGLSAAALSGLVGAQTVGVGVTKGTAIDQMGAAIAKTVSAHAGLQMRPQAMGGTQTYIEIMDQGKLEFAIANLMQAYMAVNGTGISEGHKFANVRLVATLMAFRNGLVVANDSPIKNAADLRGKRLPYGFGAAPLFRYFIDATLANGGLSASDVTQVPAVGLPQSWNLLKQGKVDGVITAVGAGPTTEMNATVHGGIRFIEMATTGPGAEKTLEILPGLYYTKVTPNPKLAGIRAPTDTFGYDFGLLANKDVPAEVVGRVVKAMYEHADEIKSTAAMWNSFDKSRMSKPHKGVSYHPGAEAFYKQVGIWKQ